MRTAAASAVARALLLALLAAILRPATGAVLVSVCKGKTCRKDGSHLTARHFEQIAAHLGEGVEVETTGCFGHCGKGPNVAVYGSTDAPPKVYSAVTKPATVAAIVEIETGAEVPDEVTACQGAVVRAKRLLTMDKPRAAADELQAVVGKADALPALREDFHELLDHALSRCS